MNNCKNCPSSQSYCDDACNSLPIDTTYNEEELIQMINDCQCDKRKHLMNQWEREFMSTCLSMTDKKIMLSEKQRDCLDEIWEKVTADG